MTVGELIEKLKELPPENGVIAYDQDGKKAYRADDAILEGGRGGDLVTIRLRDYDAIRKENAA